MKLLVFLGNPGKKYINNRHNIGFLTGEYLCNKYSISLSKRQFDAVSGKGTISGQELIFLFPQTFMNNSGQSVSAAATFYKVDVANIIVVHDEIELPFSDIRIKKGGGHKGHNGIRSMISELGSPEFNRVRFGVGRPPNENMPVAAYVLSDFSSEEKNDFETMFQKVENEILALI